MTETQTETHVSAQMKSALGRQLSREVSYPVSASDIRRWALAIYFPEEPPKLFWDEDYAKTTRYGGIVAPEDFNPFAWLTKEPGGVRAPMGGGASSNDSMEESLGIEGPGLKNILNGGAVVEYGVRMKPGDVITSVSKLAEYNERSGRLGLMLFTITETEWTNQDGELVKRTRNTSIRY